MLKESNQFRRIVLTVATASMFISIYLLEHNTTALSEAIKMHFTFQSKSSIWQENQLHISNSYWKREGGPAIIKHCIPQNAGPLRYHPKANTRFAIVSLLTTDATSLYTQSAMKLSRSIRRWLNTDRIDLVIMVTDGFGITEHWHDFETYHSVALSQAGWNVICKVPAIDHPKPVLDSRFHTAKMYSKLNLWGLTEYEALLYVDSDTLIISEPTRIFTRHYPAMVRRGYELGAARDRPAVFQHNFNAGVMLIIPRRPLHQMISSINTTAHEGSWAEQGLLNVLYRDNFYELPYIYNANLVSKIDEPELWHRYKHKISIVHYTVSKGWESFRFIMQIPDATRAFACWWYDTDDFCHLWEKI